MNKNCYVIKIVGKNKKLKVIYKYKHFMSSFQNLYKIVVAGSFSTGKTSIVDQFVDDNFYENQLSTLGVDFKTREVQTSNGCVKLII